MISSVSPFVLPQVLFYKSRKYSVIIVMLSHLFFAFFWSHLKLNFLSLARHFFRPSSRPFYRFSCLLHCTISKTFNGERSVRTFLFCRERKSESLFNRSLNLLFMIWTMKIESFFFSRRNFRLLFLSSCIPWIMKN